MIDQHINTISGASVAFIKCVLGTSVFGLGISLSFVEEATVYLRFAAAFVGLIGGVITICVGLRAFRIRKENKS